MPKRSIFLVTANPKAVRAIAAYFSDTESIPSVVRSKGDYVTLFSSKPDFVFFQGDWVDSKLVARLVQFRTESPKTKFFSLGDANSTGFAWHGSIEFPIDEKAFRKTVLAQVEFPNPIRLLVVSKEPKLIEAIRDYFETRKAPAFQITEVSDEAGFGKHCAAHLPHCLIVDSTTFTQAAELFRNLEKKESRIPAVVFIDSTTRQIPEIRKWKAPVFMEASRLLDFMPDVLALVKKLVVFS